MKTKSTLLLLLLTFACSWAQKPIFDNEILVENFAGETYNRDTDYIKMKIF